MKPFSVGCFCRLLFLLWSILCLGPISLSQPFVAAPAPSNASTVGVDERQQRPLPGTRLCCGAEMEYLGVYSADGKFRTAARIDRDAIDRQGSTGGSGGWSRPSEVPGFVNLHSRERIEENYDPPAHAAKPVKGQSLLASIRDNIVTFVYGRERVLLAPHHVAADSRGRILIVDPDIRAVHILGDGDSFRIAGGPHRRLLLPNGIAVDASDNIYIADSERGLILVYTPDGRFLRYLGKRGNESVFHYPTAIAIDRDRGRLYVLDSPRDLLFELDLEGNVLKRIGRTRPHALGKVSGETILLDLDYPTEMAIRNDELVVVDSANSRVHVIDLQTKIVAEFRMPAKPGPPAIDEVGLGVDTNGDIYVSSTRDSHVRIYGRDGSPLGSIGQPGMAMGEFNAPAGLWIDEKGRLYVADTNNSRVQVFQLSHNSGIKKDANPGVSD